MSLYHDHGWYLRPSLLLRALLLFLSMPCAFAGVYGNMLGVGLAGCTIKHKLLLTNWTYNATTATVEIPNPASYKDRRCLSIDNTVHNLPGPSGSGVLVSPCPDWKLNISEQMTSWKLASSNKLESLFVGRDSTPSFIGLCLTLSYVGMLEMINCEDASSWKIDPITWRMSVIVTNRDTELDDKASCLVALNTSCNLTYNKGFSCVDCDTMPGKLLPYCDSSLPISQRVKIFFSFIYMNEMLGANFERVGMPHKLPQGECLHGFVSDCINDTCLTIFPDALGSASSFNDTLFNAIGRAISIEGRAVDNIATYYPTLDPKGRPHSICWSPDLNPFRHPLWGRGQEVPSEDPLLCGRYGAGYVRGLQGKDDPNGKGFLRLVASPKHFVGYDLEGSTFGGMSWNRHNFTNKMSAQELIEYYSLPFKYAVEDGGAMAMMCSYNAVNVYINGTGASTGSIPACAFDSLQNGMVRDQWNFSGYIVSDCGAIADFLVNNSCSGCSGVLPTHGLCNDANYSSHCPPCTSKCLSIQMHRGGTDTSCGGSGDIIGALKSGQLSKFDLIQSSERILTVLFSLGLGNPKAEQPYQHLGIKDIGSDANQQLNLEAARQSIVLLKNDAVNGKPVLPLKIGQSIAVVGPNANATSNLLSNYHGDIPPPGKHSIVSPLEALIAAGFNATYEYGATINLHGRPPDKVALKKAVALANVSDVAIVFVGLDAGEEHESGDRNLTGAGLELTGSQKQLVQGVQKANPRTVVVLIHGAPLAIEYAKNHVPAIIDAHYPGAMGGVALSDVLIGNYNPCGRLTTSIYPKTFINRSIFDTGLRSDGGLTYTHYDGKYGSLLWEFGHGISYSQIRVKARGIKSNQTPQLLNTNYAITVATIPTTTLAHKPVTFSVEIANEAGPAACFSALGFINSEHPQAPHNRKLFDYVRLNLAAGEKKIANVNLTANTGALVEADGTMQILPGTYNIMVASVNFTLQLVGPPVIIAPPPPLRIASKSIL